MRSLLPLLLVALAVFGAVYAQQPCVSSLTVPLRISVCDTPLGTVNLQLRNNGRLQINVTLNPSVASTFRQVRYSITSGNPGADSGDYTKSNDPVFSPSQVVCGLTRRVAIAVQLRNVDGDNFIAWAVPGAVALPGGASFTVFKKNGFAGFFTIRFCPCGPPPPQACCNATGFEFKCGAGLKFCPQSSPVAGSACYCGNIQGGGVACLADTGSCAKQQCTRTSDCPIGSACQLGSCCEGQNVCVPLCGTLHSEANTCVQPPTPPPCCPADFTFRCPACSPVTGTTCPPSGNLTPCPGSPNSAQAGCYCANTAEGGVTCLADRGTCEGAKECTSSTQCPAGSVCQRQSCCSGKSVCIELCSNKFPNSAQCQAAPPKM